MEYNRWCQLNSGYKRDQSLHLLNLEDGDVETNLLEDGGLKVSHSLGVKSFNLSINWGKVHPRQAVN